MGELPFNKVCEIEDFSQPELLEIIHDAFKHEISEFPAEYPNGVASSKQWEIAMSIRALKHFGALHREANILGIGAGTEVTSFYLTRFARQVFATDLYLNPGVWADVAPTLMLSEPENLAPYEFEQNRLIVQHMDGRLLNYPDNAFDGIFSSGSIEHFGSLDFIANAAYEMGRVLKRGGVLTLSTEFKIAGPGDGWDTTTYILSPERIRRYIIQASGLELVDELQLELSPRTLDTKRSLIPFLNATKGKTSWQTQVANYPNLVLVHEGYVFCSIHLCLRKTEDYPVNPNDWARPSEQTRKAVNALKAHALPSSSPLQGTLVLDQSAVEPTPNPFPHLLKRWNAVYRRALDSRLAKRLPRPLAFFYRMLLRIRVLPQAWDAQDALFTSLISYVSAQQQRLDAQQQQLNVQTASSNVLQDDVARLLESAKAPHLPAARGWDITALVQTVKERFPIVNEAAKVDFNISGALSSVDMAAMINAFNAHLSAYDVEAFFWIEQRATWDHSDMFHNAERKVTQNGYLVLITLRHEAVIWQPEGFVLVHRSDIATNDQLLKLVIWQYIGHFEANGAV